jgi:hypothetical protein
VGNPAIIGTINGNFDRIRIGLIRDTGWVFSRMLRISRVRGDLGAIDCRNNRRRILIHGNEWLTTVTGR